MKVFRQHLEENHIDVALITNEDNVYYLTGYCDYLHMEFGRPTILVVPKDDETLLITHTIDLNTALASAHSGRIAAWNDGMGNEWREELPSALLSAVSVAMEPDYMPPMVRTYVNQIVDSRKIVSATPLLAQMQMIKSQEELRLARHAGQVANSMMDAGRAAIANGVPEFEVAIATSQAGTRKAAALIAAHYDDADMSPNTHFLQIMASGDTITKTHHRASNRITPSWILGQANVPCSSRL
jgi:Xaa-Pro dipeptidase